MIVEDDPSTGALLLRLVKRVAPRASVVLLADAQGALDHWKAAGADLVLLDWILPGISGIAVLEQIRRSEQKTTCIMISGQADRDAILAARALRIDDYIVKPFDVKQVMARLAQIIPAATQTGIAAGDLEPLADYIEHQLEQQDPGLPIDPALVDAVSHIRELDHEQRIRLLRRCQIAPALVLRTLSLANSGQYNRGLEVITSFESAVRRIGMDGLVNVAAEQSLHPGSHLTADALARLHQSYLRESMSLVGIVSKLRQNVEFDAPACRTAAVLHHLGQLSLLTLMQDWTRLERALDETTCCAILDGFGQRASEQLLIRWGIPNVIRERIGALVTRPTGIVRKETVVMRIAGLLHQGDQEQELPRLMARLGLSSGVLGIHAGPDPVALDEPEPPERMVR